MEKGLTDNGNENFHSEWLGETVSVYDKIRSEKKPYQIEVLGKKLWVLPNVFSPKYFADSVYFAQRVPESIQGDSFLEIGTGTGIVALECAEKGARTVAVDINPSAVENCQLNAEERNLEIDVRESNVFSAIEQEECFDCIFWNHPWNYTEEPNDDVLLKAGLDYKYESLFRFIREGKSHLTPGGRLLIGTGGFAKIDLIEEYANDQGYEMTVLYKDAMPLEEGGDKTIDFILYQLVPRQD